MYRSDNADLNTLIEDGVSTLNNKPYITVYETTGLTQIGQVYKFKIRAWNNIGYIDTEEIEIVLASVPDTPANPPAQDLSFHNNEHHIKINYNALTTLQNGGSAVLGYQLWRDNGEGGDLEPLYDSDFNLGLTYTDVNVAEGKTYRYMY